MSDHEKGPIGKAIDKVMDTAGGTLGAAKAAATTSSGPFVENAAIGDLYEIESARIALQRSRSAEVRAAAEQMILDHTANTHHLLAALEMNETNGTKGPPPQTLDTRRQAMIDHLREAPEDSFDKTYAEQQVMAHEETVALMRSYAGGGDNQQLRSLALSALPVVERHLEHMKMLQQHVGEAARA
jgi:putative membrane protein